MNIIPQTAYLIQERITTANGVEKTIATEPAGNDRDQAFKLLTEKIHANAPAYHGATGIRLVLLGGDR